MANIITGGTAAGTGSSASSLAALVARVRLYLDDVEGGTTDAFLWSNDDLTANLNDTISEVCMTLRLLEDETTAATCTVSFLAGASTGAIADTVTSILSARLTSQTEYLTLATATEMDLVYGRAWRDEVAGDPEVLVTTGLGDRVIRLYPPTLLADTLTLSVRRQALAPLVWATDQTTSLPIPARFHFLLYNGVIAKAFRKQDIDTYNPKKAAEHDTLYQRDIELLRRSLLKMDHHIGQAYPHYGMI